MVVEYHATNAINRDDVVVEIKPKPQESNQVDTSTTHTGMSQQDQNSPTLVFTMSQIPIDHEEVVSTQDPYDQPQDEEDWSTILTRGTRQEKWGREGIHEEDLAIMISDREDPTPTNRDLISRIYGYFERDNPAVPTQPTTGGENIQPQSKSCIDVKTSELDEEGTLTAK